MGWSIRDVARMSGVTSRTLRHYDAIGLLRPTRSGGSGYRVYDTAALLRLQRILLLRELGLPLPAIADILDGTCDETEALRRHHNQLLAERDRLSRLADTVAGTIAHLEGGGEMPAEELFEGFDKQSLAQRRARFESELVDRHGERVRDHFAEADRRTAGWTAADYQAQAQRYHEIDERLVGLLRAEVPAADERVLAVLDEHYAVVCQFWTPDATSYAGLGELYVSHPQFRERYDRRDPVLAEYLRDAMAAYAERRLR